MNPITSRSEAHVTPAVLLWARHAAGLSLASAAARLHIQETALRSWELGAALPSLAQARKLAETYKRPFAVLFLPEPPPLPEALPDFRSLGHQQINQQQLSPELELAIRKSRWQQQLAQQLAAELDEETALGFVGTSQTAEPAVLAEKVRRQLQVPIETQFSWRNSHEALRGWKLAVESHNVLVVQFQKVKLAEARAYCLRAESFPLIALNGQDAPTARCFSLFHELGHLLRGDEALCRWSASEARDAEGWCNRFAEAVLLPEADLRQAVEALPGGAHDVESVRALARRFLVSPPVLAIRLRNLKLVRRTVAEEIVSRPFVANPASGGGDYWSNLLTAQSHRFLELVLDGYRQEAIPLNKAAEWVGIAPALWPKFEAKALEKL